MGKPTGRMELLGKATLLRRGYGVPSIEGKAAMGSGERAGKRMSFKSTGVHESTWAANEFQPKRYRLTKMKCQTL